MRTEVRGRRSEVAGRALIPVLVLVVGLALAAVAQWSTPPTNPGTPGWFTPPGSVSNNTGETDPVWTSASTNYVPKTRTITINGTERTLASNVVFTLTTGGYLLSSNNLSDLTSPATARINLGLGTAATNPASAFDAAGTAASAVSSHNATNTAHSALFAAARTNATHINGVAVGTVTAGAAAGAAYTGTVYAASGTGRLTLGVSGGSVTGTVDVTGLATGTPVYVESDPIASSNLTAHIADTTEAHPQSAIDAVRTVTTIAAGTAAGTQTVNFAWGESGCVNILATNSGTIVALNWPVAVTNRCKILRAEIYNPNLRTLTYTDSASSWWWNPTSNVWTQTALSVGKFSALSIANNGSSYEVLRIGGTNATARGAL